MKYVRLIFRGKVLNYERCLIYSQFSIYEKIIESSLEDLKCTMRVTKLVQERAKQIGWMKIYFLYPLQRFFFYTQILDITTFWGLIPKGQNVFIEFWFVSHFLSLHPNFLIT